MVDGGADTLLLEHLRHGFRLAPAHAIDDAAFSGMAGYEVKNCLGFFLLLVAPFYGEAQVGTVERGDERPGMVQVKLPDDIFARDFVGGGGQGDDGTCGNCRCRIPICAYSGRKSCPHCEMQCASSMAKSEMCMSRRR